MDIKPVKTEQFPLSVPIQQSLECAEERNACIRIAKNRLLLAQICGSSEGALYCQMIIKAIEARCK